MSHYSRYKLYVYVNSIRYAVLHLSRKNSRFEYIIGNTRMRKFDEEKTLESTKPPRDRCTEAAVKQIRSLDLLEERQSSDEKHHLESIQKHWSDLTSPGVLCSSMETIIQNDKTF